LNRQFVRCSFAMKSV